MWHTFFIAAEAVHGYLPLMIEVHVMRGSDIVLVKPLSESLSIGGSPKCDVCLPGRLKPLHALLEVHGAEVVVKEVGGAVFYNGRRIDGSVTLGLSDIFDLENYRIQIGRKAKTRITRTATHKGDEAPGEGEIPYITFKKPRTKTLCQLQITVGRSKECDLVIPDGSFTQKNVSRKHVEIFVKNGAYYARDLQSKNGTKLYDLWMDDRPLPRRGTLFLGHYELPFEIDNTLVQELDENGILIPSLNPNLAPKRILGNSLALKLAKEKLDRAILNDGTVLILGENGTGKDLFARYLHFYNERRKDGPFIAVNCAAIPKQLAESYLFGHVKGAFTGAVQDSPGAFEKAHGGTLFLDEVGELPPELQAQLLRVFEDKLVEPVGSKKTISVDVRIVLATNRDIEDERKRGRFRDDLYYRCKSIVRAPALRERREDIPILLNYFLAESGRPMQVCPKTKELMLRYSWPGNVRELASSIERGILNASFRGSTVITKQDLELEYTISNCKEGRSRLQSEEWKEVLIKALHATGGNVTEVAKMLMIPKRTLYRRLEANNIDPLLYRITEQLPGNKTP